MGIVTINSGTQITIEEVEGNATLQQLYEDVICEHYTDTYREKCIRAWGKLARQGWAILPVLHELTKGNNDKLKNVAKEAIKKIDPGAPNLTDTSTVTPKRNGPLQPITTTKDIANRVDKTDNRFPVVNGYTTIWKKPEVKKVTVTEIEVKNDLSEGTRVNGVCNFCEKQTIFTNKLRQASDAIAGPKKLYCNFCLRNEMYKLRHRKNTLILSFRGIIGYYYYSFHMAKTCSMFILDLETYINLHVRLGSQNPLFRYDPESYLWFVDFGKVGTKPRQIPLNFVLETIVDILAAFNLYENVKDASPAQLFQKYKQAILDFHHHRRRPIGQRILSPTLYSCGIPNETVANKAIPVNLLRNFTPNNFIENYKFSRRGI